MKVLIASLLAACLLSSAQSPLMTVQRNPLAAIANHPRVKQAEKWVSEGRAAITAGDSQQARKLFDQAIIHLLETPANDPDRDAIERFLQNLSEEIYTIDLESLGSARSLDDIRFDKSPLDDIREMTFPVDPRMKSRVQKELQLTTSQLPLVLNDTVLGYINYFANGKGRRTLEYALKRSGRYRPMIFRILAEEGVPAELIYLAQAESGFLPRAVSYKAAVGMWQFIKETGKTYGLTQGPWTDDRLDPERATRAAARHLRDLYEEFGDWHLALAAYNCGPGCVDRAVQKTAYADYWELRNRHAVPIETTNYVPIILALTIIMKNPADYGLANFEMEEPLDYDTIEVYSNTSLQLAADAAQIPVTTLQEMNPAILRNVVPSGYFLRIPKGSTEEVTTALNLVPADKRDTWRLHKVQPGDDLDSIARLYRLPASTLEQANPKFENAAFAAVPQMTPKAKPAKVSAVKSRATRSSATRTTRVSGKPTTTKRPSTKASPAKPNRSLSKAPKPSPSARK
jgi:membrane-bound lytic murein transglycosylase D